MKLNICVAIQIKSGDFGDNVKIIKKALDHDAELIELRFDYIDNTKEITQKLADDLISLIHPKAQAIFTFRDYNEGGQIKIDNDLRLEILKLLINAKPDYLDIEMASSNKILDEVIDLSTQKKVSLIFSYHNFKKTPNLEKSLDIINRFKDKIQNKLSFDLDIVKKNIIKLIFKANSFEDNLVSLHLSKKFSEEEQKIISFCMGESGMLSRFFCVNLGSFLTFASIEGKTAPGQIHIEKIRQLHSLLFS
ncbi:MAG: type I 3-dehydroquinate dehydratase [Candidatus Lokiarchaeota archaeon]|nr:type I 3-dehydroquinate dehydratase [Candidatus Lokiarchaeota archaeon]